MGGYHQLPITPFNPPDPMEGIQKGLQLRNMQQAGQLQQQAIQGNALKLQMERQAMQSQQAIQRAYMESGGDLQKTIPLAARYGADPMALGKIKDAATAAESAAIDLLNKKGARAVQEADLMQGAMDTVKSAPPEQRAAVWQQQVVGLHRQGVDMSQVPAQYPGDAALPLIAAGVQGHKQKLDELAKQAAISKTTADAAIAQGEAANMQKYGTKEQRKPVPGVDVPFSPEVQAQKIDIAQKSRPINNNVFSRDDAKVIADEIQNGDQPPTLSGLYRNTAAVKAELARRQVPLAKMEMDWKATQKHILTLNGPQQLRMKQSIESAEGMLDKIDSLYEEWKQLAPVSGFKVLNKAALTAMKNLPGRAGAVAQALDTQIADLTADLGNVYMGGNTPTDQALKLAAKNLSADWNDETFQEGKRQARLNVQIRGNSIRHSLPSGVSENTLYPMPNQEPPKKDSLGIR